MITVDQARTAVLELATQLPCETVPLKDAAGRVLGQSVAARRNQPPFHASAMDGYAMKSTEVEQHAMFKVIGEAAAGHAFDGTVGAGQAVRIFTGAPVPEGTDFVVIQEDITRSGNVITISKDPGTKNNIRALGCDFSIGDEISAPRLLGASDIALLASMNISDVPVTRRPIVAVLATGDELVSPGQTPGPDQIIASNSYGIKAMLEQVGADVRLLPIARDTIASLKTTFDLAAGADLLVTIGGASVGDHDLVSSAALELGLERVFYKVAMRPGKPLLAGRLTKGAQHGMAMVGLPGNPVSSMVCTKLFLVPMIRKMLGLPADIGPIGQARLTCDIAANGPREHYMRAHVTYDGATPVITPSDSQDSSLLATLAQANALLIRPIEDLEHKAGETVNYLWF